YQPDGLVNQDVSNVRVQFNEPVAEASFTGDDVQMTTPSGPVDSALIVVSRVDDTTFDIGFPTQSADGDYTLVIGPDVTDLAGNGMDASHTAVFTVDQTGPRITEAVPSGEIDPPLTSFDVTFDTPIAVDTFQTSDVLLDRPGAASITPTSLTSLTDTSFRLAFSPQNVPGSYSLSIGPDVRDDAGNLMDQDVDGVRGEPQDDVFTTQVAVRAIDLEVTELTVDSFPSMQSGARLTIGWKDSNSGYGETAGSWYDGIKIVNLTTGETIVNTSLRYNAASEGNIPAGQSRSRQYEVTLPDGTRGVGELEITIEVDVFDTVVEFNAEGTAEANNSEATTAESTLAPYSDLQVTDLRVEPESGLESGASLTVHWNDVNHGDGPAGESFHDYVLIRNTTTGQVLATRVVYYDVAAGGNGAIPPEESRARQYTFTLPHGPAGVGQLEIVVVADYYDSLFEHNGDGTAEANNEETTTVESTLASYPDLEVTDLSIASTGDIQSGSSLVIHWNDVNSGNWVAGRSFYDYVTVRNTTTGQMLTTDTVFHEVAADGSGAISVGGSRARQYALMLPDGPAGAGQLEVTVVTDYYDSVFENNGAGTAEVNNTAVATVESGLPGYPDLVVAEIVAPRSTVPP
ncbi:hypothetical protein LCGC14_2149470, partial [marine sediment metagenome]